MRGKGGSGFVEDDYYDEEDDYDGYDDWEDEYDDHVAGKAGGKARTRAPRAVPLHARCMRPLLRACEYGG